jgi:hypothetical protein
LGEGRKETRKEFRNKNITLHYRADYFIQNLIFHYCTEKEGGCLTERERREGDTFLRPMEYVIGYLYK